MKKLLFSILAIIVLPCVILLSGCTVNLAGTWKFSKIKYQSGGINIEVNVGQEFEGLTLDENLFNLDLRSDGTWTLTSNFGGETATVTGTWVKSEGGITLTSVDEEGNEIIQCTVSNGELSFQIPVIGFTCVLVKE